MKLDELMGMQAKLDGYDWPAIKDAITSGEDLNEKSNRGTPYSWSLGDCPIEVFQAAVENDCNIDSMLITSLVRSGNVDALKYLVEKGIDLNQKTDVKEDFSTMAGDVMELVPFMGLERKYDGEDATFNEIAKLLLDNGVDINAEDSAGRTALFLAAIQDNVPFVNFLLDNGADKNHKNPEGKRAFNIADKKAICRKLIK